ncbi:MAG: EAL domain-containing protein, partial [Myxococcales bacterium]|nr:EAL domain-containing protein [Myxococcales bacterium]
MPLSLPRGGTDQTSSASRDWLLGQYWRSAFAIFAAALPLLLIMGRRADVWGTGVYLAVTLTCWSFGRRRLDLAARLHLLAMIPYWTWYSALDGGLPARLGIGVSEWAVLLVFPIITIVTLDGWRGTLLTFVLAEAALLTRWRGLTPVLEGTFLLASALLVGGVFRRLAVALDGALDRVRHMALHDELTALPNRRLLHERASLALRDGAPAALLFVDLNRFKTVNDALGHHVGDELLRVIAERLRDAVPGGQLVARIGGDEFAVLLTELQHVDDVVTVGEAIVERVSEPLELGGRIVHVSCSVGAALHPQHGDNVGQLMQAADMAMYRAKRDDGRVAIHGADGDESPSSRFQLEVDLWRAALRDELALEFQPILDLPTRRVVGSEALVRWHHPQRGPVPPGEFIPTAETTGTIGAISDFVLETVGNDIRGWTERGVMSHDSRISVNISASEFNRPDLLDRMDRILRATGTDPSRIELEITESVLLDDLSGAAKRLEEIDRLGMRVAIDDFGTGYSSLPYIRRFSLDML